LTLSRILGFLVPGAIILILAGLSAENGSINIWYVLGLAIMARKEELYELNYLTGATRKDGWIDIEGGAGTLFSFSSKARRELPDAHVLLDGAVEPLSKSGSFIGQHIYT